MKKALLILLIFLELFVIKIPDYVELNNLAIIEKIAVEKKDDKYKLILKEIIPLKGDQGISYKYEYHEAQAGSIKKAYQKIKKKTKKKLYLNKAKSLITNTKSAEKINDILNIEPKITIYIKKDLSKEIKK